MVPNIKYYVVTVASIFLALGVGIFMGFMLDAQGLVSSQKEDIVSQLEAKFDELSEESENTKRDIEAVRTESEKINTFLQETYPLIVRDALAGRTVSVIGVNGDYDYRELENSLVMGGATVSSFTNIKGNLVEDEENIKKLYSEISGAEYEGDIYALISSELSKVISSEGGSAFVDKLVELGYIGLDGSYEGISDSLIVAGGSKSEDEQSKKMIGSFSEKAKEAGLTVAGVERSDVEISHIETFKNARIPSVDNVETAIGKTSLVSVLRGANGNFGEKETATSLYPDLSILIEGQGAEDGQ